MQRLTLLVLALLFATLPASAQQYRTLTPEAGQDGPRRAALVLGNAAYTHATPLRNPANDAADVAAALQDVGFTVVTGTDLSLRDMRGALDDFTEASRGAEVALVFFAGHGVEVDGENYLVPVDADIQARADVAYEALSAGQVLARADEAVGDGLAVLLLDACRNDPFRTWRSSGGGSLSAMNGPSGSVIAYATAPGSVASDNPNGRNGLYTSVLLEEMRRPGVELSQLLRRVGGEVTDRSGGEQQPWLAASYVNDFYFVPGRDGTTGAPPPRAETAENPVVASLRRAGDAEYQDGKYRGALWLYGRALNLAPSDRSLRDRLTDAERGIERELDDQRAEARRQIDAARRAVDANRAALRSRYGGAAPSAEGQRTHALAHNEGNAALRDGRTEEAIHAFQRALAANPSFASTHFSMGLAYLVAGRGAESVESLETAIALGETTAYLYLPRAYTASGQPWKGYVIAEEGKRILPQEAGELTNLALNALAQTQAYALAIDGYKEAVALNNGDPLILYNLGSLLLNIEDYEQARSVLERVVAQQPSNADAHYNLGAAYYNQGRDLERWGIQDESRPLGRKSEEHFAQALRLIQQEGGDIVGTCASLERVHLLIDRPPSDFAAAYPACN